MTYNLSGRNVLVTGGSRGIGEAISERFAQQGANIIINYVSNASRAEALKSRLLETYPGIKVIAIQADVGKKEECERLVREGIEGMGGLDVIASNAGWTKFVQFSDLDGLSEEDWDKCYAVNCKANFWLLKAAKPTFDSNPDGGSLIICASTAALAPSGSSMAYAVSKSAALHLMHCLAVSAGPKVRVNAVCPGLVLTEWGDKFPQEAKDKYLGMTQTKKHVEAVDVADAFVFISQNVAMTGQKIVIDGGVVIQP
ncbi:hypothetical protein TWF106_007797 [Orbilia oligospora]|uniref:Granaticin polyketide synthase ketoacyl reductase 2 n=1 Tax=Orbilia oligospora TaxID=2813651 RepID=A0A7C8UNZ9_ORBOL|nr:hypothetical protein TWF106_007797 [Orbilia oligospora]KAF3218209.1 hypothetical protein TWF191_008253 [Orbilia oligospora]